MSALPDDIKERLVPCSLCGKKIFWGVLIRPDDSQVKIPLDPVPACYFVNMPFVQDITRKVFISRTLRNTMVSHFATCKNVDKLKRGGP